MATKTNITDVPSVTRVMAELNRKFGANTIGIASKLQTLQISRVPSGIATLDNALGGGLPIGRMVELYGPPSSGKSLISLMTIREAQKMGLECIYVDAENSFDPEWATTVGVDVNKLAVAQMSIAEDVVDTVAKLLEAHPGVIVIDSIAAMITRSEMEENMDQQFMAPKARLMSRGLAKLTTLNKHTLIIFINQVRSVITNWGGGGTDTPGGRSLKHFASIRVEVKRESTPITASGKKTDPDIIGQTVLFKTMKNKTAAPFQSGSFKFLYEGAKIEE